MASTTNRDILLDAGVPNAEAMSLDNYTFPKERLKKTLSNPNKQPLVLVSCGSFSPPTNLHLRMFEEAADYCEFETDFEVVGGFFSPVGDAYKKAGLTLGSRCTRNTSPPSRSSTTLTMSSTKSWEASLLKMARSAASMLPCSPALT
jgi:nicotinamide mononucleotide adenylyltransferase